MDKIDMFENYSYLIGPSVKRNLMKGHEEMSSSSELGEPGSSSGLGEMASSSRLSESCSNSILSYPYSNFEQSSFSFPLEKLRYPQFFPSVQL